MSNEADRNDSNGMEQIHFKGLEISLSMFSAGGLHLSPVIIFLLEQFSFGPLRELNDYEM